MTIASRIFQTLRDNDTIAVSLRDGSAVLRNGQTITFPTGNIELEKRNNNGRVTAMRVHYADDSRIVFNWSENGGAVYSAPTKGY